MRFPPLLFLVCLIAGAVLQYIKPVPIGPYAFGLGMVVGLLLLLAATGIAAAALREMKQHGTTVEPGGEPTYLVTTGPFRFTRNPLYVSLLTIVVAIAVMMNTVWLLVAAVVLLLLLDRLVVRREEAVMNRRFPDAYAIYKSRVRRWL